MISQEAGSDRHLATGRTPRRRRARSAALAEVAQVFAPRSHPKGESTMAKPSRTSRPFPSLIPGRLAAFVMALGLAVPAAGGQPEMVAPAAPATGGRAPVALSESVLTPAGQRP